MRQRHPTHSDAASSRDFFGLKKLGADINMHVQLNWQSSRFPIWLLRDRTSSRAPYADILKWLKRCVLKTRRGVKACGSSNLPIRAVSQRSLHVAMLFSLILYICSVGQAAKTWDFQSQNRVSITLRSTIWLSLKKTRREKYGQC